MSISSINGTDSIPLVASTHKVSSDPQQIALDIARELREHPDRWTQRRLVKFADGSTSNERSAVTNSGAISWCFDGHIIRRAGDDADDVRMVFQRVLGVDDHLQAWNDESGRSVQDVIAVCEQVATLSTSDAAEI